MSASTSFGCCSRLRQRLEIRGQVCELLALEGRQLDPLFLGLVLHQAAVVPHCSDQRARRADHGRGRQIARRLAALAANRVAMEAALALQDLLTTRATARCRVEVMRRVEISDNIRHLLPCELRGLDMTLL